MVRMVLYHRFMGLIDADYCYHYVGDSLRLHIFI
jgi:hypothetical protein